MRTTHRLHWPIVFVLALLAIPTAATASDWSWNLTPYAWLPDTTASVQVNDQEVISGEIDFDDLIDDADFALMAHLEGRRGGLGVFADLIIGDFGDEPRVFDRPNRTVQAESDLELTILDVGGVWYPGEEDSGFGIHYGARLLDIDQEVDVLQVGALPTDRRIFELARTEVDGLLGVRYLAELSESWSFAFYGDLSAGGTDGTWNALAAFGYHFGSEDQYGVRFGYRHFETELGDEDRAAKVETDLAMSGPLLGFTFAF